MCASAAASATCDREARPAASRARSVCEKASEGVRCYHLRQHRPEACHLRQSQRLRCTGCQSRQQSCEIPAPWHRGIRRTGRRSSRQHTYTLGDYRWITAARDPMSRETPYPWLPVSHPRTLVGVSCTPRARRWAGAPPTGGPPPTPLRGAGIRCLEGTGNSLSQLRAGGTPCDARRRGHAWPDCRRRHSTSVPSVP